ncbi:zinc dependent phospholipase C family protein [Paenibacillus planticolens]|uniref:Phospholipase C/D domain-containing protein n=1 Tax=Paenibacillus planticolens TaxID=2654976 RepID=A0ABX1ZPT2_9BACL|nr:zinc dependent phospholipase C family protein [Paenibacillus planticolens]NOV02095.1 hypothetical protein [Paenibacillus planticolens]
MPWPMVHFSIAEQLFDHHPSPEFLLGSVAPDAIHMREEATRQDKGRTHLCEEDGTMPTLAVLHDFYKNSMSDDYAYRQFMLGYVSHLYTDLRWTQRVWTDFVDKLNHECEGPHGQVKSIYNREVAQIEYNLCRSENWTDRVLTSVLLAAPFAVNALLAESEIKQYGERVVRNLRDESQEPRILPRYITDQIVSEFIARTVRELRELIHEWDKDAN